MQYRWNFEDGRPPANFDTFPVALLTVFQVSKEDLLEYRNLVIKLKLILYIKSILNFQ